MPPRTAMELQTHLDDDTLAAYVDGRLAMAELGRADRHIDACGSCRRELSTLASIQSEPHVNLGDAPTGTLGRYHLLRELGRGAMGIVLRAYDPELARPVAIKLVRDVDAQTRDLLRREARALAKLRHPNVVTVHDVILEDDAVCVAMELVEGDTLRAYCEGRGLREILDACVRAGRGLAAAHDAGVIHRDFKPENVLCGSDGEVKVSDFGLARVAEDTPDGALCGTPAYMAPEVLRREGATVASDQYSYCVSVFELLAGERPPGDLPATHASVPAWVMRALRRGLARDPAARFPTMHTLIAALADDPGVRRRRRLLLGAGALAAVATGALIVQLMPRTAAATCAVDDPWTTPQRDAVRESLAAAADADTADRVTAGLDRYAARWAASQREACTAADPRTLGCLDRSRRELAALAGVLASADRKVAARAIETIEQLADPRSCTASFTALPTDTAQRVLAEYGSTVLARGNALQYAGRIDEADALAAGLLAQLSPGAPLRAETLQLRARVEMDRGRHDQAEQLLFDALHAAEQGHDDVLAATLWVEIVGATGGQKQRFDLALSNARAADAALARIRPSVELQLRYGYTFGTLLLTHGQLDEARRRLEAVLPLAASEPLRQAQLGLVEIALCDVERQQSKLAAARERCTAGIARLERALGPTHVRVAVTMSQIGALAYAERDFTAAETSFQRAIDIFELRGVREHIGYALAQSNLGAVHSERAQLAKAKTFYTTALATFDRHHPTHPQRLMPVQGLASIALREGRPAEAIPFYVQIRDARRATLAPEHPSVLAADYNLALAYRANKQPAETAKILETLAANAQKPGSESWLIAARALDLMGTLAADRKDRANAIALRERALAALAHVDLPVERAYLLIHLGHARLMNKQPELAIAPLEEALTALLAHEGDAYDLGTLRVTLARALLDSNADRKRAVEVMRQAAKDLAAARTGEALAAYRDTAAKWLRKHGP